MFCFILIVQIVRGSHFIYNCFFQTEKEIYNLLKPIGKIAIDYVCKINDVSVEVSVTRAMNNNNSYRGCFAEKDVIKLLTDKLNDLKGEFRLQMGDFVQMS